MHRLIESVPVIISLLAIHSPFFVCVCVCRPARGGGAGYSEEAQQRFSSAKSISSDQYFGRSSENDSVSYMYVHKYI